MFDDFKSNIDIVEVSVVFYNATAKQLLQQRQLWGKLRLKKPLLLLQLQAMLQLLFLIVNRIEYIFNVSSVNFDMNKYSMDLLLNFNITSLIFFRFFFLSIRSFSKIRYLFIFFLSSLLRTYSFFLIIYLFSLFC